MFHTIEFVVEVKTDLERSPRNRLERVAFRKGMRVAAQIKPYVMEGVAGPVEVADLLFADGSAVSKVPFAWFTLVD